MKRKLRVLVLASGDKTGGGSGFQELVEFSRTTPPVLDANIVAVVSNHEDGGVFKRARALGVEFICWPRTFTAPGIPKFSGKVSGGFSDLLGLVEVCARA